MSLNILHHKSWHVWRKDNIERVERDEEAERAKGRANALARSSAEHAHRLRALRGEDEPQTDAAASPRREDLERADAEAAEAARLAERDRAPTAADGVQFGGRDVADLLASGPEWWSSRPQRRRRAGEAVRVANALRADPVPGRAFAASVDAGRRDVRSLVRVPEAVTAAAGVAAADGGSARVGGRRRRKRRRDSEPSTDADDTCVRGRRRRRQRTKAEGGARDRSHCTSPAERLDAASLAVLRAERLERESGAAV